MPPKRRVRPPSNYERFGRGRGALPRAFELMKPIEQLDRAAIAWATGLFEGEGGVCADRSGREPRLHVSQSGAEDAVPLVLQRYRDAVGGIGAIYGPQLRPPRLPKWQYRASGIETVEYIVGLMDPFMGDVKRQQAKGVLDKAKVLRTGERRPGNHFGRPLNVACIRGHPYDRVYIDRRGGRNCMECRRIREAERRARRKIG